MRIKMTAAALLVATFASGCAVTEVHQVRAQAEDKASAVAERAQEVFQKPTAPRVVDSDGIWVSKRAVLVKEEQLPAVFRSQFGITLAKPSSLADLVNLLSRETGLRFAFAPDVQRESVTPLLNAGFTNEDDLKTLLNRVTAQANMSWRYRDGSVNLYRYETKVFNIAALPGTNEFASTTSSKSGDSGKASSGQDLKYNFKLDFWQSVTNDIKNLLQADKDAAYTVSNTGSVTVTATPQLLAKVEEFVKGTNASQMRQVSLLVHAYDVETKKGADFGLQWKAIYSNLNKDLGVNMTTPAASPTTPSGVINAILGPATGSMFANSQLVLNALSSAGVASMSAEAAQTVMNGEPLMVTSQRRVGYLSEVQQTVTGSTTAASQVSLKQSSEVEGYTITLTPRVVGGDYVQLMGVIDMASILGFNKAESGGQSIQTPDTTTQSLPIRIGLRSGETYVFAVRQNASNGAGSGIAGSSILAAPLGGNHSAKQSERVTLVTVTAHVINPTTN